MLRSASSEVARVATFASATFHARLRCRNVCGGAKSIVVMVVYSGPAMARLMHSDLQGRRWGRGVRALEGRRVGRWYKQGCDMKRLVISNRNQCDLKGASRQRDVQRRESLLSPVIRARLISHSTQPCSDNSISKMKVHWLVPIAPSYARRCLNGLIGTQTMRCWGRETILRCPDQTSGYTDYLLNAVRTRWVGSSSPQVI